MININPTTDKRIWTVTKDGKEVFTGPMTEAMSAYTAAQNATRPAATVSPRKARRLEQIREQREAGR